MCEFWLSSCSKRCTVVIACSWNGLEMKLRPLLDFVFQVLMTNDHLKYHQILKYLNHPLDPQELCQQLVTGHGKEGRGQNEVELIGSAWPNGFGLPVIVTCHDKVEYLTCSSPNLAILSCPSPTPLSLALNINHDELSLTFMMTMMTRQSFCLLKWSAFLATGCRLIFPLAAGSRGGWRAAYWSAGGEEENMGEGKKVFR